MAYMFDVASKFNQPISTCVIQEAVIEHIHYIPKDVKGWDVSSVTDMSYMFQFASSFNQQLDSWDVSSVTNMSHMFNKACRFDQSLNSWDVSSVNDMFRMFGLPHNNYSDPGKPCRIHPDNVLWFDFKSGYWER